MKRRKKSASEQKTTTIQVHADLKDKLDLLKIMLGKDDLNALISTLTDDYVSKNDVKVDPKIEKFLKRLRR